MSQVPNRLAPALWCRAFGAVSRVEAWSVLAYKTSYLATTVAIAVRALILAALWRSLTVAHGAPNQPWQATVSYVVIAITIVSITSPLRPSTLPARVRSGAIAHDMRRPIGLFSIAIGRSLGQIFSSLPQLALVVVALFVSGVWSPPNLSAVVGGAIAFLVAVIISVLMNQLMGLLAFWFTDLVGVNLAYAVIVRLASGSMIPYWFMNHQLARVLQILPFGGQAFLPAAIVTGALPNWVLPTVVQVCWIPLIGVAAVVMTKVGLRRLVIHGG